jgi:dolichol-phosphate mannosyltransferase
MKEVIVLIPTRNEEAGVKEVIQRIPVEDLGKIGVSVRTIVVDGRSTDKTVEIALELGAEVISQSGPKGKGYGVREAFNSIISEDSREERAVIMLDGDATYHPEDIPRFIESLSDKDVVWGSRIRGNIQKNAMSFTNNLGNRILSLVASVTFLSRTTDVCTGYWGFRESALRRMELTAGGFTLEADLFCTSKKMGMRTKEIVIDYDHREGDTKLKWYIDGPKIMMKIIRKRFTG